MIRTFDSVAINLIANDPSVRPALGGVGVLDMTEFCNNINNFCFITEQKDGGYCLHNIGHGVYIIHTISLKSARGKPMIDLYKSMFKFMFTATDCIELRSFVPDGNIAAERLCGVAGLRKTYRRENYFDLSGTKVGCQFYTLTFEEWVANSDTCKKRGEGFRTFIESHVKGDNHPEDEINDKFVGAAILGCENGNPLKGIAKYNVWAGTTGYASAKIESFNPLVINIGTCLLQLYDNKLEALKIFKEPIINA